MAYKLNEFGGIIDLASGERYDINNLFNTNDNAPDVKTSTFVIPQNVVVKTTDYTGCNGTTPDCLELDGVEVTADTPLYVNAKIPTCIDEYNQIAPVLSQGLVETVATEMADKSISTALSKLYADASDNTGLMITNQGINDAINTIGKIVNTLMAHGAKRPSDIVLLMTPQVYQNIQMFSYGSITPSPLSALTDTMAYIKNTFGVGEVYVIDAEVLNNGTTTGDIKQIVGYVKELALYKPFCETETQLVQHTLADDPTAIKPYYRVVSGKVIGAKLVDANALCFGHCTSSSLLFEGHTTGHTKGKAKEAPKGDK